MNTKFLCELIEKNSRVILPEFGAFLVKEDGTGVFKPKNITFSPFLRYNDGTVEDALASAQKISKDEARKQINGFIDQVKAKLTEENNFQLENFGNLYLDNRGSVHFTTEEEKATAKNLSAPNQNTLVEESKTPIEQPKEVKQAPSTKKKIEEPKKPIQPTAKAKKTKDEPKVAHEVTSPVKEAKVEKIVIPPVETKHEKPIEAAKPPVPKVPISTPARPEVKAVKAKKPKSGGNGTGRAILFGTLIGLGFVVILAGGWYIIDNNIISLSSKKSQTIIPEKEPIGGTENVNEEPILDSEAQETKGIFDDEFDKLSTEIDNAAETKKTAEDKPKISDKRLASRDDEDIKRVIPPSSPDGMYHVIVGSFRNQEYADKFCDDMKSSGYSSRVIPQRSGMHAVTLGTYLTREAASEAMNEFKTKHPNVWLLKQ